MKEEIMWRKEKINMFPNTLLKKKKKSPGSYQNIVD